MARVTVEDCVEKVEDRFELVVLAAQRAKDISAGADINIDRNDEKNTVIALREIAANHISAEDLRVNLVKHYQKEHFVTPTKNSDGTEISEDELDQEDFELKEIEASEEESTLHETITEEEIETQAADQVAAELSQADDLSFEDENLDVDD